jgi:4-hydroxybenzoate polyprenyltransferase
MLVPALLRAAHLGPTVAVTAVAGLLAVSAHLEPGKQLLVVLAVLSGQLTIGWSNDLIDTRRDRQVGRADKPLATGELRRGTVLTGVAVSAICCVVFSLALGWRSGLCHLGPGVGAGLAYNLGLKGTRWSWLPYAVAFAALPAVVTFARQPPGLPPWPVLAAGALLGVGAHLVNVLPDLADDAATGIRGLPHRLGALASQRTATTVLVLGSLIVVLGPAGVPDVWGWAALGVTGLLAVVALAGRGKTPFRAAVAIALVNVAMLTLAG